MNTVFLLVVLLFTPNNGGYDVDVAVVPHSTPAECVADLKRFDDQPNIIGYCVQGELNDAPITYIVE